jgi:hypothetical protein
MIKFINNHTMAHFIFRNHSKLELLKIAKTKFSSYYLTFKCLLKTVREALDSMVSSDSWKDLKDRATFVSKKHEFQKVDTKLDGQFWKQVRYILQFTKPIYSMNWFAETNMPMIREVYEHMDSMLGQIKDIIELRYVIWYDHIHKPVVKRWDNLNVPFHALAHVLTTKN